MPITYKHIITPGGSLKKEGCFYPFFFVYQPLTINNNSPPFRKTCYKT